jgi:hypothetical protein
MRLTFLAVGVVGAGHAGARTNVFRTREQKSIAGVARSYTDILLRALPDTIG